MDLIGVSPNVLFSYGELFIPLVVLGGALGVPLPSTLVLLAAGALQGGGVLGLLPVAVLALFGAVLGDGGSYLLGRYGGPRVLKSLTRGGRAGGVQKARGSFERWGGSTILLTRFLLTPLALPTNLFAGSSGYPFGRFLVFSAAGQAMWVSIFLGLGYLFAGSWETLGTVAGNLSWSLLGAVALTFGIYRLYPRLSSSAVTRRLAAYIPTRRATRASGLSCAGGDPGEPGRTGVALWRSRHSEVAIAPSVQG